MNIADLTPENVAKAVNGKIKRDGNILCFCPIHEASGAHNPSLTLKITDEGRIIFHCQSQHCDEQHFAGIRDHLVKCGLPKSRVGGKKKVPEIIRYDYFDIDGNYAWSKIKDPSKPRDKRFSCAVVVADRKKRHCSSTYLQSSKSFTNTGTANRRRLCGPAHHLPS
jgi:hypothetical protein